MLNEQTATSLIYDAGSDVACVHLKASQGTVRTRTVDGALLLDAHGFLVGVDLEPRGPDRVVVMLGPHEAVATSIATRVSVMSDASTAVYDVRIRGARAAIRAHEKNPYAK